MDRTGQREEGKGKRGGLLFVVLQASRSIRLLFFLRKRTPGRFDSCEVMMIHDAMMHDA
jgi:hypothetical protein